MIVNTRPIEERTDRELNAIIVKLNDKKESPEILIQIIDNEEYGQEIQIYFHVSEDSPCKIHISDGTNVALSDGDASVFLNFIKHN